MAITLDTHVLIWYFDKTLNKKLSGKALQKIKEAEKNSILYIPIIVLMEILYLTEKGKLNLSFTKLVTKIENSSNYEIVPFDTELLHIAKDLQRLEAHDRLILATALIKKTYLISKDRELRNTGHDIIW